MLPFAPQAKLQPKGFRVTFTVVPQPVALPPPVPEAPPVALPEAPPVGPVPVDAPPAFGVPAVPPEEAPLPTYRSLRRRLRYSRSAPQEKRAIPRAERNGRQK